MTDPLQPMLELLAAGLVSVPEVPVDICANLEREPRSGRVMVAGELLSADRARALAGKLYRAADQLDRLLGAP